MQLSEHIYQLRCQANLSQEEMAELFGVSRQAVQKWESGTAQPELDNIIKLAQHFHLSLDHLLLERDYRVMEEMNKELKPVFSSMHTWELYSSDMHHEYVQCMEEGLDVEEYRDLFDAVNKMPMNEYREAVADVLFKITQSAAPRPDYPYVEPSDLAGIQACCVPVSVESVQPNKEKLEEKISGAWYGRIVGCLLGKPIEGIRRHELLPLLKETGNYPLTRYLRSTDITEERAARYKFQLLGKCYADVISCAPADDDTNYTVLYQQIVEKYGRDFTPADVAQAWVDYQPKRAYCTAERIAYCNMVNGYQPPDTAYYKNRYREWIGAQIRADYFGYINPGDPKTASEMAFRDASISHIKNGIYGEMFIAAMIALAAVSTDIPAVIRGALSYVPVKSRLYEQIDRILTDYQNGVTEENAFNSLLDIYDDRNGHHWCHTISNACIVVLALLYGAGDFSRSICLAVQTGFDTDCNGATVGSVLGMMFGKRSIDPCWTKPLNDRLSTNIFGVEIATISELVEKTMQHLAK